MRSTQLGRPLEQFKRVVVLQLLETARVERMLRQRHLAQQDLLALLRIVIVLEHLIEHEVEEFLVRHE